MIPGLSGAEERRFGLASKISIFRVIPLSDSTSVVPPSDGVGEPDYLRRLREKICFEHMNAENAHRFAECIDVFTHPRYELMPTGEIFDGAARVDELLNENKTAFPDFYFGVSEVGHSDSSVFVEGAFSGTHLGSWRGLPATGRKVKVPMLIVFRFEGERMMCERVYFDLNTVLQQLGVAWDPNSAVGRISAGINHPLTIARALFRMIGLTRK
jgi:steroid delta-isomerase-like uncharacterized protein